MNNTAKQCGIVLESLLVPATILGATGLTWDHLKSVIQQQMGAGNYAAAEKLIDILGNVDSGTPDAMIDFVTNLPGRLNTLAADLGLAAGSFDNVLAGFDWDTFAQQLQGPSRSLPTPSSR